MSSKISQTGLKKRKTRHAGDNDTDDTMLNNMMQFMLREHEIDRRTRREDREADERARREENRLRRQENSMMKTMMMFFMSQQSNTTRREVSVD